MFTPNIIKSPGPCTRKRFFVRSSIRYYKTPHPVKDLKSLTLDDFKPPIALKTEFPKITKPKRVTITNSKKHKTVFGELCVTGKYACVNNKFVSITRNNIGLDTNDFFQHKDLNFMYFY